MGATAFTSIRFFAHIPLFSVSPSARTIGKPSWLPGAVGKQGGRAGDVSKVFGHPLCYVTRKERSSARLIFVIQKKAIAALGPGKSASRVWSFHSFCSALLFYRNVRYVRRPKCRHRGSGKRLQAFRNDAVAQRIVGDPERTVIDKDRPDDIAGILHALARLTAFQQPSRRDEQEIARKTPQQTVQRDLEGNCRRDPTWNKRLHLAIVRGYQQSAKNDAGARGAADPLQRQCTRLQPLCRIMSRRVYLARQVTCRHRKRT